MKKRLLSTCALLVLALTFLVVARVVQIIASLNAQEHVIKDALRTAPAGTLLSNAPDGAKRFIETGTLVFETAYLFNFQKTKGNPMFNMRLSPRVTTDRQDGWVGLYEGHWYVKIY